jgi:hypothetical protein
MGDIMVTKASPTAGAGTANRRPERRQHRGEDPHGDDRGAACSSALPPGRARLFEGAAGGTWLQINGQSCSTVHAKGHRDGGP